MYLPLALPLLLFGFVLLLVLFVVMIEVRVLSYAYRKIGVRPRYMIILLLLTLLGSHFNIPLYSASVPGLVPAGQLGSQLSFLAPDTLGKDHAPVSGAGTKLTSQAGSVTVSVGSSWLSAQPASAFPLTIDPTVGINPDTPYSYLSTGASCAGCGIGCYPAVRQSPKAVKESLKHTRPRSVATSVGGV